LGSRYRKGDLGGGKRVVVGGELRPEKRLTNPVFGETSSKKVLTSKGGIRFDRGKNWGECSGEGNRPRV